MTAVCVINKNQVKFDFEMLKLKPDELARFRPSLSERNGRRAAHEAAQTGEAGASYPAAQKYRIAIGLVTSENKVRTKTP